MIIIVGGFKNVNVVYVVGTDMSDEDADMLYEDADMSDEEEYMVEFWRDFGSLWEENIARIVMEVFERDCLY